MNWTILKNDLRRNRSINLALLLFIIFSACLAVLSVAVATQTFTSIEALYRKAQPPHFLQMHKGPIDQAAIDAFMAEDERVIDWQTVKMLNVYGASIEIAGSGGNFDLSDCRLDIGLVKQNGSRDLLLDAGHQMPQLSPGGIGMPVILKEMYGMELGDRMLLELDGQVQEFEIQTFVLDAQMNSTMASSTRILLSDSDFAALEDQAGEVEYLIEAYFNDPKEAADFQTAYENAALPQNGQAVTYSIIFLLSALTDIITVFVMLLAAALLILIAFISVRFTIMAALEEEIGEIGTMKAIGFRYRDIRDLYMVKYRVMAASGAAAGCLLALLIQGVFTDHIRETFGGTGLTAAAAGLAAAVAVLVFLLVSGCCRLMLRRIRRVTVVDALVMRKGSGRDRTRVRDGLWRSRRLPVDWALALREVACGFRNWIVVFAVVLIAMVLILVPLNLLNTMGSPAFITYMGSSLEDILIEVENDERLEAGAAQARAILSADTDVEAFYEYRRVRALTADPSGKPMNLQIDSGLNAGGALQYLEGRAPETGGEIALSLLNAEKAVKAVGDGITVRTSAGDKTFVVAGIYQDVTGGGFSAKATYGFPEQPAVKYVFSVDLVDAADPESKAAEWSSAIGAGVSVDPMADFIDQTLGGAARQLGLIVAATGVIGGLLALLITVLFLKLRLAKDRADIAAMKAIGFSAQAIRLQYLVKAGTVALAGVLAGAAISEFAGGAIVNMALGFSGLGIRRVELLSDPPVSWLLCPLLMLALILASTYAVSAVIRRYDIMAMINE